MRIPLNLLSTKLRSDWVEVPAHAGLRSEGVGRIKLQEIPGDVFDDLVDAVRATEEELDALEKASPKDPKKLRSAKQAKREARAALMEACVIDHDASTFASVVPTLDPSSQQGEAMLIQLTNLGFTLGEAHTALKTGIASKPFHKATCAFFYERCQPYHRFATNLLQFIKRFQACDNPTPEDYWPKEETSSPLDKPKEATE